MVDKKILVSGLTGAGIVTIIFLTILFGQAGNNPVGYCKSTEEFCIAVDGFSGGSKTRCYNETDMNWWEAPYCKEGWQIVENDLMLPEKNITQNTEAGIKYICKYGKECIKK